MKAVVLFQEGFSSQVATWIQEDARRAGIEVTCQKVPETLNDPAVLAEYDQNLCRMLSDCNRCIILALKKMQDPDSLAGLAMKRSEQILGGMVQTVLLEDFGLNYSYLPAARQMIDWSEAVSLVTGTLFESELRNLYEQKKERLFRQFLNLDAYKRYCHETTRISRALGLANVPEISALPSLDVLNPFECRKSTDLKEHREFLNAKGTWLRKVKSSKKPVAFVFGMEEGDLDFFMENQFWQDSSSRLYLNGSDFENCEQFASSLAALLAARENDYRHTLLSDAIGPIPHLESAPELLDSKEYDCCGRLTDLLLKLYGNWSIDGGRQVTVYIHHLDQIPDPQNEIIHPAVMFFSDNSLNSLRGLQFVISVNRYSEVGRICEMLASSYDNESVVDLDMSLKLSQW